MIHWVAYSEAIDDSHPMTTSKKHIRMLQEIVVGWRDATVLELGSHAGLSVAAMALAAPEARFISVDLCDTVPEAARVAHWADIGLTNITAVAGDAGKYLAGCTADSYSMVFHDAIHGPDAFREYLRCAVVAKIVVIHDFEQLPQSMQWSLYDRFGRIRTDRDDLGRVLFVGVR